MRCLPSTVRINPIARRRFGNARHPRRSNMPSRCAPDVSFGSGIADRPPNLWATMIRDLMIGGASVEDMLTLWASSLREAKQRMRPLFTQERVAISAGQFFDGLLGNEPRKTGWMSVIVR